MVLLTDSEIKNIKDISYEMIYKKDLKEKRIKNKIKSLNIYLQRVYRLMRANQQHKIYLENNEKFALLDSYEIDFDRILKREIQAINQEIEELEKKLKNN